MRLAEAQVVAQTPEPLPSPVRRCAAASQGRALHAANANPPPKTYVILRLSAREAKARFWRLKRIPHRDTQRTSKQPPNPPQALCAPRHAAGGFPFGGPGTLSLAKHQRKRPRRTQIVGQNKKNKSAPGFCLGRFCGYGSLEEENQFKRAEMGGSCPC